MRYKLPELSDEGEILKYIESHHENGVESISASNGLTSMEYSDWVKMIHNNTIVPNGNWGRSITYLVYDSEKMVGLLNIRYEMSEELRLIYGDIGYSVKPTERRKGYATQMLKYALEECRNLGMDTVLLGCYKDNIGSIRTIINNGGNWLHESEKDGKESLYYEVDLKKVKKYK